MSVATVLVCILLLLLPGYMLVSIRNTRASVGSMGSKDGYHSAMSLSSQDARKYAQHIIQFRYIIGSVFLSVVSLLFVLFIPAENMITLITLAGIALGFQAVVLLFLMASIEISLQRYRRNTK